MMFTKVLLLYNVYMYTHVYLFFNDLRLYSYCTERCINTSRCCQREGKLKYLDGFVFDGSFNFCDVWY